MFRLYICIGLISTVNTLPDLIVRGDVQICIANLILDDVVVIECDDLVGGVCKV